MRELKGWLKSTGIELKIMKNTYKNSQREFKANNNLLLDIIRLKREYRYRHIAYSELRGKTRSQIENPRSENMPNESAILKIKDAYREQETLCISA